jgi:hypothetical protein
MKPAHEMPKPRMERCPVTRMRWFPELFSTNDFTVPGAATKQGRRQKPCSRTGHFPPGLLFTNGLRLPVAVLLRSAIFGREKQQKSLPGRVDSRNHHNS